MAGAEKGPPDKKIVKKAQRKQNEKESKVVPSHETGSAQSNTYPGRTSREATGTNDASRFNGISEIGRKAPGRSGSPQRNNYSGRAPNGATGTNASARFDVNSERGMEALGSNDGIPQNLPTPSGFDRDFLLPLQALPEHLRLQILFNHLSTQRSYVAEGNNSEVYQYERERKKEKARMLLTGRADELRAAGVILDEKMIEGLLEMFELAYLS